MSYLGRSAKLSLKAQEKVSFLATAGQTVKTGLSYVPSFVEVYVNGILLTDTTDFTATNGNSVTFTVALALNDEVTVVSLKTFTVADHYTKSDANTLLSAKAPIASPVFTGPLTSESAAATNIVAKSTNGNGGYMNFQGLASNGTQTFGVNHNGTIFTTSGLAVGGNGAANTLDDYEEGTWTPVIKSGSGTIAYSGGMTATYIKIGKQVHVQMNLAGGTTSGSAGSTATIEGLPFQAAGGNYRTTGSHIFFYSSGLRFSANNTTVHINASASKIAPYYQTSGTGGYTPANISAVGSGSYVFLSATYQIA